MKGGKNEELAWKEEERVRKGDNNSEIECNRKKKLRYEQ